MRQIFRLWDTAHSGKLTALQLAQALRAANVSIVDGDGVADVDERSLSVADLEQLCFTVAGGGAAPGGGADMYEYEKLIALVSVAMGGQTSTHETDDL